MFHFFLPYAENSCPKLCVTYQVFGIVEMLAAKKSQAWRKIGKNNHCEIKP